jgi:GT2 family glycosyltransferase
MADATRTAAVVVTWEGGDATRRCVASLLAQVPPLERVVVVDNASGAAERAALRRDFAGEPRVELLLLDENRHFAGGMNAGAAHAFRAGAGRVLLLNNDTVIEPFATARLGAALDADRDAGVGGPCVRDLAHPERVLSAGERHVLWLLCLPRTLLRYRRRRERPYRVSGVMGCALLVTRECFEATGGFDEQIQVYYEDVDFCLGARARGFAIVVAPDAVVRHDGLRGFASGLTPWAAYLKARNPWLLLRRHGGPLAWLAFVPSCAAMVAASAVVYLARGRRDVVRALARGTGAGVRAVFGAPVVPAGAPTAWR